MKCRECNADMIVDDKDLDFYGSGTIYYICPRCTGSCNLKIFRNRPVLEYWHFENDSVQDYVVKSSI